MKKTDLEQKGFFKKEELRRAPGKGLAGKFIFSPFSVMRTMDGEWQRRKRQWLELGIQSEVGRGDSTKKYAKAYNIGMNAKKDNNWQVEDNLGSGTSIFDPVLCELMYTWFCPENGLVIDPFAGGSVRGIVAGYTGRKYWGCELRPEQVDANNVQKQTIIPDGEIEWVCGDSMRELRKAPEGDFVFTCPPYGDLEVYSELEGDISNVRYDEFLRLYKIIIKRACHGLKENRFTCFVVGNYRNKKTGAYHDLVGDTVRAFTEAGLVYYNEAVLVTAIGSLPVRVTRQFEASRKLGKTHQNILIFYKGDPKQVKEKYTKIKS